KMRTIRVRIALRSNPVLGSLRDAQTRDLLASRVDTGERRLLRVGQGGAVAWRNERRRAAALATFTGAVAEAERSQAPVRAAIARAGGRARESDPLNNTLVADVPLDAVPSLKRLALSIEPVRVERRLATGLALSSEVVGAPTFWAGGFAGGLGPSDV